MIDQCASLGPARDYNSDLTNDGTDRSNQLARFNLNLFFALDAILRAPTLTEAARSIHLSQPAMSLALKRLRSFFQDELVTYHHGQCDLSPLAKHIRPLVSDILEKSQEVVALSRAFDPATEIRTMTIMGPEAILFFLIPRLTAAFAVNAPGIILQTLQWPDENTSNRSDVVILPDWAAHPDVPFKVLTVEQISCMVSESAGIIPPGNVPPMDEATFLAHRHASRSECYDLSYWEEGSDARRLLMARDIGATVPTLDALSLLARHKGLIATTTTRFAQKQRALSPALATIRAPTALGPVTFVAQTSIHRQDEPAVQWLLDQIATTAGP